MIIDIDEIFRTDLDGFDADLVGFDCLGDWGWDMNEPWRCEWSKGCGAKTPKECPLMKQMALIARAPKRLQ